MFSFLRRIASRIKRLLAVEIQRTYLYRLSKADGWAASAPNNTNIQWEMLAPPGVSRLLDMGWFDVNEGLQRLGRGDCCYTIFADGRLAHYGWVQRSGVHCITEAAISLPIEKGEFWIYHARTAEWARQRGFSKATVRRMLKDHFEAGYSTGWVYASKDNKASRRSVEGAGFALAAIITALRVGSRYFCLRQVNQGQ
jgi:RimJ/RimL family protein N-acetyltransferase